MAGSWGLGWTGGFGGAWDGFFGSWFWVFVLFGLEFSS